MNYRTLAKGALALSLSLIVGSAMAVNTTTTDVQKYGATFENQANPPENDYDYVVDTPVTTYATSSGNGESSGWFGAAEDESKIIAVTGGQALQLNTDAGVLTNKLASSIATDLNDNGIAAAGAYIETEAKFVASDTLDAGVVGGTDDTKFAIYAYADESKSPCTTNLVVYHAYDDPTNVGNNGVSYTNEVFSNISINTEVYTKLRIEMKQLEVDEDVFQNVFSVSVADGNPITSQLALADGGEKIWFRTVENIDLNEDNALLSSITFKGTGEVDNLAVGIINKTTTYAIDWSASQNVIASNLTDNVQLAAGDTNFVAGVQLGFYPTVGTIQSVTVNGTAETVADPYLYTVGTADAIVTVVAAQVLDDNWTIAGFNPRGEWTDPTAVAADSKTLFYSNLVVNIDPVGDGRTIVAAWVGAQVTASAAASADLANWKFDYDSQSGSRVTGASFSQNKDGDNFLYWWIPITADAVRAAIANQSDIVKTMVVYTDSASSAEAQTLTVSICPKNIEITNTGDVENGETIDVDDWTEQGAVEPTVITVAQTIGAHGSSVSNGNFQAAAGVATPITITADQGYVVAQIVTNGAPVAAALGETSVTFDAVFSDAEGANNSIVATFAKDNAWFLDPFVRNKFMPGITTENTQTSARDEANGVFAVGTAPGASSAGIAQWSFVDITNEFGKITPCDYSLVKSNSHNSEYWGRSITAVSSFESFISCNNQNAGVVVVSPYNGPWDGDGDVSYTISMNMGESELSAPKLYPVAANDAGTFLYGTDTAGSKIYKFAIVADAQDNTKIGSLQYVASWDFTGGGDLKGIGVGTFNRNDVVYMAKNADRGLWTLDVATDTLTKTAATIVGEVYQIYTTGIVDGTPRLVVAGGANINLYDLAADGTLLSATPLFTTATTGLCYPNTTKERFGFIPLDDDSKVIISSYHTGNKMGISVVEKKPANLIVRGTFDDGETTDDRSVAFGAAASETFNAPAGATITAVTVNGVAQSVAEDAKSYTYEAAELTEYVYVNITAEFPKYMVSWAGSQNVVVSNATEEVSGTSGEFEAGVVLTFYPTEGSITNVNGTAQDPALASYPYTVTTDANQSIVILAGAQSQPAQKPAWAEASGDGTDSDPYWAWATAHAAEQDLYAEGADYSAQYLMNVDADKTPVLKIDSIGVAAGVVQLVVSATDGTDPISLKTINGVLSVAVGDTLTSLTPTACNASVNNEDGRATINLPANSGNFFRARVDFAAPAGE